MGTAVAVGHLGTICGCALPGADPVHPRAHTGHSAVLTWGAPRTPPTRPCLSFVTEHLGPQFSPINVQFPEVLLQPLSGVGTGGRDRAHTGFWCPPSFLLAHLQDEAGSAGPMQNSGARRCTSGVHRHTTQSTSGLACKEEAACRVVVAHAGNPRACILAPVHPGSEKEGPSGARIENRVVLYRASSHVWSCTFLVLKGKQISKSVLCHTSSHTFKGRTRGSVWGGGWNSLSLVVAQSSPMPSLPESGDIGFYPCPQKPRLWRVDCNAWCFSACGPGCLPFP